MSNVAKMWGEVNQLELKTALTNLGFDYSTWIDGCLVSDEKPEEDDDEDEGILRDEW